MKNVALRARSLCHRQLRDVLHTKFPRPVPSTLICRRAIQTTTEAPKKPYYVTSPIFYVNASPHAGHLYTLVLTDILKRWHILLGDKGAKLLTGTDEHGMKIQKAAEKAKLDTKTFCDNTAVQFQTLANSANISYDRFIRTTDTDHKAAVEHFWRELNRRGYLYESKHEGWYAVSDETFYPESKVHLVLDPETGRKLYASMETGKEVEWTSETNYHFKLSAFRERLLEHYRQNPDFIVPKARMNFVVNEVEDGLSDLSVSRPSTRLTWGVPVPDDESQTIYVWLDALINYITMAGYPFASKERSEALWPPNCQVIGKDIVRFHCIYWPAFLMALDLPLPKQFLTHAHWTMNREKMSKSAGNVVNPFYAMDRFGVDTVRYYMAHDGGIVDDAAYENFYIIREYKRGLQDGLGNLLTRTINARVWDLRDCVEATRKILETTPSAIEENETCRKHFAYLKKARAVASNLMKELNPRHTLHSIMDVVYTTNRFYQQIAPWNLAKTDQDQMRIAVYLGGESLRIVSILLQPFMPEKAAQALDLLGVGLQNRNMSFAMPGTDWTYGRDSPSKHATKRLSEKEKEHLLIFPPLASDS